MGETHTKRRALRAGNGEVQMQPPQSLGLLSRVRQYMEALIRHGGLLPLLGLLSNVVVDILDYLLGIAVPVPREARGLFFVFCFGWANFRVFDRLHGSRPRILVRRSSIALGDIVGLVRGEVRPHAGIHVSFDAMLDSFSLPHLLIGDMNVVSRE